MEEKLVDILQEDVNVRGKDGGKNSFTHNVSNNELCTEKNKNVPVKIPVTAEYVRSWLDAQPEDGQLNEIFNSDSASPIPVYENNVDINTESDLEQIILPNVIELPIISQGTSGLRNIRGVYCPATASEGSDATELERGDREILVHRQPRVAPSSGLVANENSDCDRGLMQRLCEMMARENKKVNDENCIKIQTILIQNSNALRDMQNDLRIVRADNTSDTRALVNEIVELKNNMNKIEGDINILQNSVKGDINRIDVNISGKFAQGHELATDVIVAVKGMDSQIQGVGDKIDQLRYDMEVTQGDVAQLKFDLYDEIEGRVKEVKGVKHQLDSLGEHVKEVNVEMGARNANTEIQVRVLQSEVKGLERAIVGMTRDQEELKGEVVRLEGLVKATSQQGNMLNDQIHLIGIKVDRVGEVIPTLIKTTIVQTLKTFEVNGRRDDNAIHCLPKVDVTPAPTAPSQVPMNRNITPVQQLPGGQAVSNYESTLPSPMVQLPMGQPDCNYQNNVPNEPQVPEDQRNYNFMNNLNSLAQLSRGQPNENFLNNVTAAPQMAEMPQNIKCVPNLTSFTQLSGGQPVQNHLNEVPLASQGPGCPQCQNYVRSVSPIPQLPSGQPNQNLVETLVKVPQLSAGHPSYDYMGNTVQVPQLPGGQLSQKFLSGILPVPQVPGGTQNQNLSSNIPAISSSPLVPSSYRMPPPLPVQTVPNALGAISKLHNTRSDQVIADMVKRDKKPRFTGENVSPPTFIQEVETFFALIEITGDREKLQLLPTFLVENTAEWWKLVSDQANTWNQAKELILDHYFNDFDRQRYKAEWRELECKNFGSVEEFALRGLKILNTIKVRDTQQKKYHRITMKLPDPLRDYLLGKPFASPQDFLNSIKEAMLVKNFKSKDYCRKVKSAVTNPSANSSPPSSQAGSTSNNNSGDGTSYRGMNPRYRGNPRNYVPQFRYNNGGGSNYNNNGYRGNGNRRAPTPPRMPPRTPPRGQTNRNNNSNAGGSNNRQPRGQTYYRSNGGNRNATNQSAATSGTTAPTTGTGVNLVAATPASTTSSTRPPSPTINNYNFCFSPEMLKALTTHQSKYDLNGNCETEVEEPQEN